MSRSRPSTRGAFTLVEVLVGILILGLGLLGLGAIYPAVALQQRGAGDAVEGQAAADAAVAFFQGNQWLNERSEPVAAAGAARVVKGWEAALLADGASRGLDWQSIDDDATSLVRMTNDGSADAGTIIIGAGAGGQGYDLPTTGVGEVNITTRQRLMPRVEDDGQPGFKDARFVWDIVARRQPKAWEGTPTGEPIPVRVRRIINRPVEVALFVRRLDAGIRNREGVTYMPVAEDARGNATLDGVGRYAPIRYMKLAVWDGAFPNATIPTRDTNPMVRYVRLSDNSPISSGMDREGVETAIAQTGQKFALGNGTVITVLSVQRPSDSDFSVLRIDPEVPLASFEVGTDEVEALFTVQPPVAVRVFTVHNGGAM